MVLALMEKRKKWRANSNPCRARKAVCVLATRIARKLNNYLNILQMKVSSDRPPDQAEFGQMRATTSRDAALW